MSKIITGTENFTNGPYRVPTGSDNKSIADRIVKEFIERMATHNHNGDSSAQAVLPTSTSEVFANADITYTPIVVGNGEPNAGQFITDTITLAQITPTTKVMHFFYKLPSDSIWSRFYPTVIVLGPTQIQLVMSVDTMDIKVVA
jgi:hypothetical protein